MTTTDEEILEAARRFVNAFYADHTMRRLVHRGDTVTSILVPLLTYDGVKKEVEFSTRTEIVRFFKRNKGLFLQLSEFIEFNEQSNLCQQCSLHKVYHRDQGYKNIDYVNYDTCDNFIQRKITV
jgi:hypothetical protein